MGTTGLLRDPIPHLLDTRLYHKLLDHSPVGTTTGARACIMLITPSKWTPMGTTPYFDFSDSRRLNKLLSGPHAPMDLHVVPLSLGPSSPLWPHSLPKFTVPAWCSRQHAPPPPSVGPLKN